MAATWIEATAKRAGGDLTERACVRAAAAFPPHSLGRGVKCAHTGVEPPHTSGDAVRLL